MVSPKRLLADVRADVGQLIGCEVTQLVLDHRVGLRLVRFEGEIARVDVLLEIGVTSQLSDEGVPERIDPEEPTTLAGVLHLLRKRIEHASLDEQLTLVVRFDDGAVLTVARDVRVESWELSGAGVNGVLIGPV